MHESASRLRGGPHDPRNSGPVLALELRLSCWPEGRWMPAVCYLDTGASTDMLCLGWLLDAHAQVSDDPLPPVRTHGTQSQKAWSWLATDVKVRVRFRTPVGLVERPVPNPVVGLGDNHQGRADFELFGAKRLVDGTARKPGPEDLLLGVPFLRDNGLVFLHDLALDEPRWHLLWPGHDRSNQQTADELRAVVASGG